MKKMFFAAPLMAMLLVACGDDGSGDGNTGGSGSGGSGTGNDGGMAATGGSGGNTATGGTGGTTADACAGITPMRTVLTPEELLAMLDDKDFELINVHVPNAGEIPGTDTHIAYTDVDAIEAYLNNDKAAKVVLYCRTGPMSQIAGDELVARGYCNISDMTAGSYTWEQLGYPYTP